MSRYTLHQSKYFAEQILLQRPQSSIDGLMSAMTGVKVDLNITERIFCEYPGGPLYTANEIMEIMNRNLKDATKYQTEARR